MYEFEEWIRSVGSDNGTTSLWGARTLSAATRLSAPMASKTKGDGSLGSSDPKLPSLAQSSGQQGSSRIEAMAKARSEQARRAKAGGGATRAASDQESVAETAKTGTAVGTKSRAPATPAASRSTIDPRGDAVDPDGLPAGLSALAAGSSGHGGSLAAARGTTSTGGEREVESGASIARTRHGAGEVSPSSASLVGVSSSIRRFLFGASNPGGLYPDAVSHAAPTEPIAP